MNRSKTISILSDDLNITKDNVENYFDFLDSLRESGKINMFGAVSYLIDYDNNLNKKDAGTILKAWMNSFNDR